ncbi:hypothetical protein BGZ75_003262, partial [Mortierella antarctica]
DVREMPNTQDRARRLPAVYKAIDNLQACKPKTEGDGDAMEVDDGQDGGQGGAQ